MIGYVAWFGGLALLGISFIIVTVRQLKSGVAMKSYWDGSRATRKAHPSYLWANVIPTGAVAAAAIIALLISFLQVLNAPK